MFPLVYLTSSAVKCLLDRSTLKEKVPIFVDLNQQALRTNSAAKFKLRNNGQLMEKGVYRSAQKTASSAYDTVQLQEARSGFAASSLARVLACFLEWKNRGSELLSRKL